MKPRLVVIGIDDIARLFRDYAGMAGFPDDAQVDTLLFNKAERKMCLRISSASFPSNQPPETISFTLKRTHIV